MSKTSYSWPIPWLSLACMVLAATISYSQTLDTRVTVGAWNLEWLGTPARRGSLGARTPESLEKIATTIDQVLDLEVAVLVEINTNATQWTTLRNALTSRGFAFITTISGSQRIVNTYDVDEVDLLPSSEPHEAEVSTTYTRADLDGSDDCRSSNLRKPLFATFQAGQFDFTVIGVHLKSGRVPGNCTDATFPEFVRAEQAVDILEEIERRQQTDAIDDDIIIVGDCNGGLGDDSLNVLRVGGFRVLTEEANRSPSSGTFSYRKGSTQSVLDHIAFRAVTDREWIARSTMYLPALTTMTSEELGEFRRVSSDHGPVWAEFNTNLADDDP